jgi:hypothetical protein
MSTSKRMNGSVAPVSAQAISSPASSQPKGCDSTDPTAPCPQAVPVAGEARTAAGAVATLIHSKAPTSHSATRPRPHPGARYAALGRVLVAQLAVGTTSTAALPVMRTWVCVGPLLSLRVVPRIAVRVAASTMSVAPGVNPDTPAAAVAEEV